MTHKFFITAVWISLCLTNVAAIAAPFAYVANGDSIVSVIDTASNTVTAAVPTGGGQTIGITVNPDGTRVYLTNVTNDNVSVINTVTNTVIATVAVGTDPYGVAVNPAGTRVYVANRNSDNVSVIDATSNTVMATVPVGVNPVGVAVNPAGTRVYVTNGTSNNVSVIDAASNTVVATVVVAGNPVGVAINPAGTRVYVANQQVGGSISVIDAASNTVIGNILVGAQPAGIALNPAGTRAYVANAFDPSVMVIDTATNVVIATVAVGNTPWGISVNPAGTRVYVANANSNNVSVIDTASNVVVTTVPVGNAPYSFGQFIQPVVPASGNNPTSKPTYLTINRTDDDSDAYTEVNNPVRMTYSFPGCNAAELSLVMSAPKIGLPWSFLDTSLRWQLLPADLSMITPFMSFYAYNGIQQELFYGDLPAGTYDIFLVCDIRNGHLDITKLNTGSTLSGMYAFRKIRVR